MQPSNDVVVMKKTVTTESNYREDFKRFLTIYLKKNLRSLMLEIFFFRFDYFKFTFMLYQEILKFP